MGTPWNIRGSASQLFYQDKEAPEYRAYLAIADVPHPDRSILGSFIDNAVDPREAAQYLLDKTSKGDDCEAPKEAAVLQFLSDWKALADKLRPSLANELSNETKKLIFERDGGCCCITRTYFESPFDSKLEYAHIGSPRLVTDPDLSEGAALFEMLSAFLSRDLLEAARRLVPVHPPCGEPESFSNLWLLSAEAFAAMEKGEVSLDVRSWENEPDTSLAQSYSIRTAQTPQVTTIPSEELLGIHERLSKTLAWMDIKEYMDTSSENVAEKAPSRPSFLLRLFRSVWTMFPSFIRASVYEILFRIGSRIYGPSLSMTVWKLPFGLYLRRGFPDQAPQYRVEAHTLHMVEKSTHIPAPRAIDILETRHRSYLLMTCVPGRPIGQMLGLMTDEQVEQAVIDLKRYLSELRRIPREPSGYDVCNSQGGGILDWRIPDSQREELRFKTEADFNKYLSLFFWEDIRKRAAKSHDIPHKIVFTHGDLNPRNILAENGKITGIVDWENAGWFPEYWEYTKAHYTVRSVIRWLADVVDVVLEGYRDELHVENMLSDLLGPF